MKARPGCEDSDTEAGESCLHLVMTASPVALDECAACCGAGDTIVLLNTAVTLLAGPASLERAEIPVPMFCLAADAHAHGLADCFAQRGVLLIDDQGLVGLVCQHRHCLSWK
jgi:sulfur relay protein TusB/DsrH